MKEAPFIHSLFVSYGKKVPREERIPYTVGEKLTSEVLSRLAEHIRSGWAQSVQLEDETMENSLAADFREGWATICIGRSHTQKTRYRGYPPGGGSDCPFCPDRPAPSCLRVGGIDPLSQNKEVVHHERERQQHL